MAVSTAWFGPMGMPFRHPFAGNSQQRVPQPLALPVPGSACAQNTQQPPPPRPPPPPAPLSDPVIRWLRDLPIDGR
jgi:hypothetical protein